MSIGRLSPRSDWLGVSALVALVLVFWAPWIATRVVPVPGDQQTWMLPWSAASLPEPHAQQWEPFWWDGVAQFYPWRLHLHRGLRAGQWPLWNDRQLCGYPFVGNGQSAMFYPPNWLYGLLHPSRGFALLAAVHFALACLLTFGYGRSVGLGATAAVYAAVAFGFGGFMVGLTPLPTLMSSAAWSPGCLWGIELMFRGTTARGVALLAVCCGMTVLAGHLQIAAYVLLATAVYAVARAVWAACRAQHVPWGALVAGAALGVALAAVQLLPSLELGQRSPRGAGTATTEVFTRFVQPRALQPVELATLVTPDALGSPARGDYRGGLFALGAAYGERCGFVGALTLLLAAWGLVRGRRPLRWGFALAAGLVLWAAMGGLPARLIFFGVPKIGLAGGFTRLLCLYTLFAAMLGGLGLEALQDWVRRRGDNWSRHAATLGVLAVVVVCLELLPWAWLTLPSVSADRLYPPTQATRLLQEAWRPGDRMVAVTSRDGWGLASRPHAVFPPNSATAYDRLEGLEGYDSLFPLSYDRLAGAIERGRRSPLANGNMVLLENVGSDLMALAGVRWVMSQAHSLTPVPGAAITQVDGVELWRLPTCFPRAFTTRQAVAGGSEVLDALRHAPYEAAGLRDVPGCSRVWLDLPARAEPRNLVITNTCYPGWHAWVGGRPAPVVPVGGVFQAIALPAGEAASVLLAFTPATVVVGMFLTLVAAAALAALAGFAGYSRRRTDPPPPAA